MKRLSEGEFVPTKMSMVALLTSSMLILMGGAAVAPGLPGISAHFSEYDDLVSFIITLPHLAVAIAGFLMGVIADRFGKVRTLIASLLIFIVTGAGSFLLNDIYLILVLRFFLGFGLAGIVTTVTALIGSYYTGPSRIRMLGLQSAAMGVGILVLEFTGGFLSEFGWNYPFLVYLVAIPIMVIALVSLREPTAEMEKSDAEVIDGNTDRTMLAVCYFSIFIGMVILFVIPTKMPTFMETTLGVSSTLMGLYLGIHGLSNTASSCMHRKVALVMTPMQQIIAAFVILAVALALPYALGGSEIVCILTLVIAGLAVGQLVPSIVGLIVNASNSSNRGKMMGIYAVFLNMGQFTVSLATIPLLGIAGGSYPDMFLIFAGLAGIVAAFLSVIYLVKGRTKQTV